MARTRTEVEFAPSEERTAGTIFSNFLGLEVKVPYRDGRQLKVARGTLVSIAEEFVKIDGRLGIIIIHTRNIEKMALLSEHDSLDDEHSPPLERRGEERGTDRSRPIPLRRGER